MLQLSTLLQQLLSSVGGLSKLWSVRYLTIVSNSSKGEECPLAIRAMLRSRSDQEFQSLREEINKWRTMLDKIELQLDSAEEQTEALCLSL